MLWVLGRRHHRYLDSMDGFIYAAARLSDESKPQRIGLIIKYYMIKNLYDESIIHSFN